MNEHQAQFLLEEYRTLKAEVEYRVKATERVELLVVGSLAGLLTWLGQQDAVSSELWWMPVGLVVFGFLRQVSLLNRIIEVTTYIQEIESAFCTQKPHGWETCLARIRRKPKGHLISVSGYLLWLALLIVTTIIAINGGFSQPPSP